MAVRLVLMHLPCRGVPLCVCCWSSVPSSPTSPTPFLPQCNFACTPCYHNADANKVRIDGAHTVTEVARQMSTLSELRGPHGHCQLIGGEVSLLPAEDHAAALEVMRFYGRLTPMSFTHGDFDFEYLVRLAVRPDGSRRFDRLDWAVHFDSFMVGRRGARRVTSEADLHPARARFMDMMKRLKREHGVDFYVAHNMTVQPGNVRQIPDVVRAAKTMGFRMLSFQPAAYVGDERRWAEAGSASDYRLLSADDGEGVWAQVATGAGRSLPYGLFQMGDVRCNRTCFGALVGRVDDPDCPYVPFFLDTSAADAALRDLLLAHLGTIVLPPATLAVKIARLLVGRPRVAIAAVRWLRRWVWRAGGPLRVLRFRPRMLTLVMHRFMHAEDVKAAWSLMEGGASHTDVAAVAAGGRVAETMERLQACSYAMAHPADGRTVPACVQHSVLDPGENAALADLLPLKGVAVPAAAVPPPTKAPAM